MLFLMSNNPVERQKEAPTRVDADRVFDAYLARTLPILDANDVLYAIESSTDYNPVPELGRIVVPLLAINFEDDLINPPELSILEHNIRLVKRGKAIVIPRSDRTRGHGTHTLAAVWKEHLKKLLSETTLGKSWAGRASSSSARDHDLGNPYRRGRQRRILRRGDQGLGTGPPPPPPPPTTIGLIDMI